MTDRAVRACEAISLFCLPSLDNRDRRATLAMTDRAVRAREAISLFLVGQP